jgi:hypothetical protein
MKHIPKDSNAKLNALSKEAAKGLSTAINTLLKAIRPQYSSMPLLSKVIT